MKIKITEESQIELDLLNFDIVKSINKLTKSLSIGDLKGISQILVTDLPSNKNKAKASYIKKYKSNPANIEIYLINLFSHIKNKESFNLMIPIQEIALAQAFYHEVGHHVREIRTHNISRRHSEKFAVTYSITVLNKYILENESSINSCFDNLEKIAHNKGLSLEIIKNMREGWKNMYQKALNDSSAHNV